MEKKVHLFFFWSKFLFCWAKQLQNHSFSFDFSISETPAGLIAENLLKAKEIALNDSRVPEQLKNYLQKALDVALGLDPYLDAMATSERYESSFVTLCFIPVIVWICSYIFCLAYAINIGGSGKRKNER